MRSKVQKLSPSFKIWLRGKGGHVVGEGGASLLKGIEIYGSIAKAAKKIGVSYKFAWDQLEEMERRLGVPLLLRRRGGAVGGGAELTESARMLLKQYEKMERYVDRVIQDEDTWEAISLKISARNRLRGVVKQVNKGDVTSTVKIEVNVPVTITAVITREAVEDLQIKPGDSVEAVIKSTEVMVAKE